jgi:hypothetical protein
MSAYDFEVNEQIVGKAKSVKDQLGIIQSITGEGKKRKLEVLFADNKLRTMTVYGIKKLTNLQPEVHVNQATDGSDNEAMLGDGFIDEDEVSSSSSEPENNLLNEGFIQ